MRYLALLLLAGCASQLTPEEAEWQEGIDRENWRNCTTVYRNHGKPTISKHPLPGGHNRWFNLKNDLVYNNCERLLGDYWIDY